MKRILAFVMSLAAFAGAETPAHDQGCPAKCATCETAQESALKYLEGGIFKGKTPLNSGNGAQARQVAKIMTGLACLSSAHPEKHEALFEKIRDEVIAAKGGGNWFQAFAGLFLAEAVLQHKATVQDLQPFVRRIIQGQNKEGGWGHGFSAMDTYPGTLLSTTGWSIAALALAKKAGAEVNPAAIEKTLLLLRTVQGEDGSFPYGGYTYRKGFEAGRSCSIFLALQWLDPASAESLRTTDYLRRHWKDIGNGHAEPCMHILEGAMAAQVVGGHDHAEYREAWIAPLLACQRQDGRFDCPLPDCPNCQAEEVLGDPDAYYRTAFFATALGVGRLKALERMAGAKKTGARSNAAEAGPVAALTEAWESPTGDAWQVVSCEGRLLVLRGGDRARCASLSPDSGKESWGSEIEGGASSFSTDGSRVFIFGDRVTALNAATGQVLWENEEGAEAGKCAAGQLLVSSRSGRLRSLDPKSGEEIWAAAAKGGAIVINGGVRVADDGSSYAAVEGRFYAYGADGRSLWSLRGAHTDASAAFGTPALCGDNVVVGSTDGVLTCRVRKTGKELWKTEVPTGVLSCYGESALLVLGHDGSLRRLDPADGHVLWAFRGGDCSMPTGFQVRGDFAWLKVEGDSFIRKIDVRDGKLLGHFEAGENRWFVGADALFVIRNDKLVKFEEPHR